MLIPWRWLAGCVVGVGVLAATGWGLAGMVVMSLQELDEFAPPIGVVSDDVGAPAHSG